MNAGVVVAVFTRHGIDLDEQAAQGVYRAVVHAGYDPQAVAQLVDEYGQALAGAPETVAAAEAVVAALRGGQR